MLFFLKFLMYSVEIVTAVLLIGIILIQKSKEEGLGVAFGAQMGESLFGSRTGNVLTRITVILAGVFLLNTLILGIVVTKTAAGRSGSGSLIDRAASSAPAAPAPQAMPMGAGAEAPLAPAAVPATAPMSGTVDVPTAPAAVPVTPAPATP